MPKVVDRPITKHRRPNEANEFIVVHSETSNTEHTIRKSEIARWCPSTNYSPGTRLFFRTGDTMVVFEDYNSITDCMTED